MVSTHTGDRRILQRMPWAVSAVGWVVCSVFGLGALGLFLLGTIAWWQALLFLGGLTAFVIAPFMIFQKTVEVDDRFLYVSRVGKAAVIPLDQIQQVTEVVMLYARFFTIHLASDSAFGRAIRFDLTTGYSAAYRELKRLQEMTNQRELQNHLTNR